MKRILTFAALAAAASLQIQAASFTLTFESAAHGQIITDDFETSHGVVIEGINNDNADPNAPDWAVAFDSELTGTRDDDLEDPWTGGNLPSNTKLGKLLIIQENDVNTGDPDIADLPDDEGTRLNPTGSLIFDFVRSVLSFGLDLVDVENLTVENGKLIFFGNNGGISEVAFSTLPGRDGASWGNNSANRISPFLASDFGFGSIEKVEVQLGGSGAIDNITWTVPDTGSSLALLGAAFLCLATFSRRRKQS